MTLFPTHRVAEEFDDVLAGRATTEVAERHSSLVRTVQTLRSVPAVTPRPEFSADLRERLMAAAVTELTPVAPQVRRLHQPPRRRSRRLGTAAATIVIIGGSAGMAAAASGALPGEPLYPVKRGIEQTTAALRTSDASQGQALLGQAQNRLDELSTLMEDGNASQSLLASSVDSFRSEADQGSTKLFEAFQSDGDGDHIAVVRDFTTTQMARVQSLTKGADLDSDTVLVDVADTLADIDQQARVLCNSCGPQATATPPSSLVDGLSASTVRNLITRPVHQAQADVALADRLRQLQQAAQGAAGQVQTGTGNGTRTSTGGATGGATGDDPVTSTITKAGDLVPAITSDEPVKNLVTGVTGTLDDSTGDTVKKVTDGVTKTVDGVTQTVDGVTKSLLP